MLKYDPKKLGSVPVVRRRPSTLREMLLTFDVFEGDDSFDFDGDDGGDSSSTAAAFMFSGGCFRSPHGGGDDDDIAASVAAGEHAS